MTKQPKNLALVLRMLRDSAKEARAYCPEYAPTIQNRIDALICADERHCIATDDLFMPDFPDDWEPDMQHGANWDRGVPPM